LGNKVFEMSTEFGNQVVCNQSAGFEVQIDIKFGNFLRCCIISMRMVL